MILMLVWVSYSILALDNCQPIRHPPRDPSRSELRALRSLNQSLSLCQSFITLNQTFPTFDAYCISQNKTSVSYRCIFIPQKSARSQQLSHMVCLRSLVKRWLFSQTVHPDTDL